MSLKISPKNLKAGHVNLTFQHGDINDAVIVLRFLDILSGLDSEALSWVRTVSFVNAYDQIGIVFNEKATWKGRERADRAAERMAKILWNLGAPPRVQVHGAEGTEYFRSFIDPARDDDPDVEF